MKKICYTANTIIFKYIFHLKSACYLFEVYAAQFQSRDKRPNFTFEDYLRPLQVSFEAEPSNTHNFSLKLILKLSVIFFPYSREPLTTYY